VEEEEVCATVAPAPVETQKKKRDKNELKYVFIIRSPYSPDKKQQ
ncbi:hypothetical protein Pcinc_043769, partial [Petrolisthes cinctipes]